MQMCVVDYAARQIRQLCGELRGVRPFLRDHTVVQASAQQRTD